MRALRQIYTEPGIKSVRVIPEPVLLTTRLENLIDVTEGSVWARESCLPGTTFARSPQLEPEWPLWTG